MLSLSRLIPTIQHQDWLRHCVLSMFTLMSRGVFVLPSLEELEEFLCPALLEEAHQRALDGLHLGTGNFGYPPVTIDKAACDLLEFQIARNIGVNKDFGELSSCDDEFGDEINGVIAVTTKLGWWGLVWPEFTV